METAINKKTSNGKSVVLFQDDINKLSYYVATWEKQDVNWFDNEENEDYLPINYKRTINMSLNDAINKFNNL